MRTFSESEIAAAAPNANALANARKISQGGGFLSRSRAADDTFYMGECKGSGKSAYLVSADFIDEEHPVFRCNCPSRQFPCKHSLALMFEMAAGKDFEIGEIPRDILDKRAKKAARDGKKAEAQAASVGGGPSNGSSAARIKKLKKQLEGLSMMKQITDSLLNTGLAAMGSAGVNNYRSLAKQLGDYYLPGPQIYMNRLAGEMEAYQKDADLVHFHETVEILKKLRALEKKASAYLTEKLEKDEPAADDDILYEELGGIWKLDQLKELGLKKENARLLQLSFQSDYDDARKEYIDLGYWADVDTGEISCTYNYRPVKALKYVKAEDSCFDLLKIPTLVCYPGSYNRRVRWESADFEPVSPEICRRLKNLAFSDIDTAMKTVKNQIKNTLSPDYCAVMIGFRQIVEIRDGADKVSAGETGESAAEVSAGMTGESAAEGSDMTSLSRLALTDQKGRFLEICRRPARHGCYGGGFPEAEVLLDPVEVLRHLPDKSFCFQDQALFGLLYYDSSDRSMKLHPLSLITDSGILRLLY